MWKKLIFKWASHHLCTSDVNIKHWFVTYSANSESSHWFTN